MAKEIFRFAPTSKHRSGECGAARLPVVPG